MRIKVSGLLIDKYEQTNTNKQTGEVKQSLKAVLYQKDSHQAISITVEKPTYDKIEEMKQLTLDCEVGTFVSNGKAIQYFKEVA
ncbi:hypothetical protein [Sedimentibacter sp.]|uniref:hypothetical protein n=1 Tax=Sedimentibacter sp. TaxID=1960295 RepID=UPI00289BC346|nr:hypothetical protein [Sedimentibacter sp.]